MGRVTFFRVKRTEQPEGDEAPGASDWAGDMIYTRCGFMPRVDAAGEQPGIWMLQTAV